MNHFYLRRGVSLFLCVLFMVAANAQSIEQKLKADKRVSDFTMNPHLKTPSFINLQAGAGVSGTDAKTFIQKTFGLSAQHELRMVSTTELANKVKVEKYKQYFRGIRVEHSAYNVIIKNGTIAAIGAEAYPLAESFPTAPQLGTENARSKALDFVRAAKYAWEAIEEDKRLYPGNVYMQQKLEALKQQYTPKAELVIAKDVYGTKEARLAYKFDVLAVQPISRNIIYVDALTGKILLRDAVIKHIDKMRSDPKPDSLYYVPNYQYYQLADKNHFRQKAPRPFVSELGTGLTRYSGVRQIFTTRVVVPLTGAQDPNNPDAALTYSGVDPRVPVSGETVFILKDDTRGGGIETYDCNAVGGVPLSLPQIQATALAFVDRDNIWKDEADQGAVTREDLIRGNPLRDGSNGSSEATNDDIAIDAHWGAGIVYDYWKNIHNRLSYDNKNTAIKSYVHYGPAYDNAFWNGSSMTYGDGSGTAVGGGFRPLVSLDVCGHEIGHGVCTFTSDLVYESESGAMNEGLSDIWAAAVERYAKINVDPTLKYEEFQIGEQISADNIGLRRMDNPKAKTDPDTYGGRYWQNPDCVPSLANDQCGVHTNSGVLNKWFYLMVMGPLKTTGSPVPYTDDGVADKPRTTPAGTNWVENAGNNYGALANFIGIGFDKAEQITYLMELSLSPNARFADARAASITAAKVLYGPCSQEEITVTDAWFGVNVGEAWAGCTAPTLSVTVLNTTVNEGSGGCDGFIEVPLGISLSAAQTQPTTITFTVIGGTAEPHDYELSANAVTFTTGQTGNRGIVLRIKNDDMVEGDETLVLQATSNIGGLSFTETITILDDDVEPRLGETFTLLEENFETTPEDNLPPNWARVDKTSPSGAVWNVRSPQPSALTWTTKRAYIYNPNRPLLDPKAQASYDDLVASFVVLRTPLIDARGLDSVRLRFLFSVGGEGACSPACDYGEVMYSLDGVNFNRFTVDTTREARDASEPLYFSPTDSTYSQLLPRVVSNRQFYLGFVWINDALVGTNSSITIDNVLVTGQGRNIESDSTSRTRTPVAMEPNAPVYFYSLEDKGLLSRMINASANMGCVTDTLVRFGAGTEPYQTTKRSRKVHQITATQNSNATYTLTLYYTAAELAGFTVPPSQLRILKSSAPTIEQANASNSIIVTPRFIDSSARGFYGYEATFTGLSLFALVEPQATPLPVTCIDFKAAKDAGNVVLNWNVGSDAPGSRFEVERSTDGVGFTRLGVVSSNGSGQYRFTDNTVAGLRAAHYRLKEVEANGATRYLCTVLYVGLDGRQVFNIGSIYPNPGRGEAVVTITLSDPRKLRIEYVNTVGQVVNVQNQQLPAGATRLPMAVNALASGSYLVRFKDEEGNVVNSQQYIKQ